MRLIDADALLTERMRSKYYHLPNGDTAIPLIDIEHAPTVEERKKGKWILSEDRCWKTCSECGVEVDVSMGLGIFVDDIGVDEMNFCPNCGSEMDVERRTQDVSKSELIQD